MKFSYMGYSSWKYRSEAIQSRLHNILECLEEIYKEIEFDCLVVHGTSGTWLAPLLIMSGYNVVMVRKDGERSHGSPIEGPGDNMETGPNLTRGVFIDDLICSGDTIRRVRELLKEHRKGDELKLVAIALHDYSECEQREYFQELPIYGKQCAF